jgi:hypothetical protein
MSLYSDCQTREPIYNVILVFKPHVPLISIALLGSRKVKIVLAAALRHHVDVFGITKSIKVDGELWKNQTNDPET